MEYQLDEPTCNILTNQVGIALGLVNSNNSYLWELGHYYADLIISRVMMIKLHEKQSTKGNKDLKNQIPIDRMKFPALIKNFKKEFPDIKILDKQITEQHEKVRNFFQHRIDQTYQMIHKEYARFYVEIAQNFLELCGISKKMYYEIKCQEYAINPFQDHSIVKTLKIITKCCIEHKWGLLFQQLGVNENLQELRKYFEIEWHIFLKYYELKDISMNLNFFKDHFSITVFYKEEKLEFYEKDELSYPLFFRFFKKLFFKFLLTHQPETPSQILQGMAEEELRKIIGMNIKMFLSKKDIDEVLKEIYIKEMERKKKTLEEMERNKENLKIKKIK